MGATNFDHASFGKDADEAFRKAVDEAAWENGHGGYTGTIAEKTEFQMVKVPSGRKSLRNLMREADRVNYGDMKIEQVQEKYRRAVTAINFINNDKWGPAGCIELTGKEAREYRDRHGLKGKRGGVYLFFGLASC